ncbi:outer membrane protein transport protein [Flavobacteriaceae bacterium MHTCC 0001]
MKKIQLLYIGLLSVSTIFGQDISDALRYSQNNIEGTARFRALSGAFGALGGDMSAVSLNPASSAVFSQSHASFSLGNTELNNDTQYFNGGGSLNDSNFDLLQGGVAFVFKNTSNSPWRKFSIGIAYDRTGNFDDNWFAVGTNTNSNNFNNTIASYFSDYANGLRLDEISAFPNETLDQAYINIGNDLGFANQQGFLGYESFILEPEVNADNNTSYLLNVAEGNFNHDYTLASSGLNGKIGVNIAAQYGDNLYLGANFNSHFIDYQRSTLLFENNSNAGSIIQQVDFENNLSTRGSGFSFQLGAILKLSNEFRVGATYDSPTWFTIEEETSQFLGTVRDDNGTNATQIINPQITNIYPSYRLQTPARITGSAAYVFSNKGLLSFDYSRKDYGAIKFRPDADFAGLNADIGDILTSAATYRLGGEYKHKQFSFRGGYRFEESPYVDGVTVGDLTGFSLGFGYNFGNTKLDVTYDQWQRTDQTSLYNIGLVDTATIDRQNSTISLTLGFNI